MSAQAYQGAWTVNRASGKGFLPVFLVSGFRVDWYPDSQTVTVARQRYDVARHLTLHRSTWVRDLMRQFAPEFAILADTDFLDRVRGGKPFALANVLSTYQGSSAAKPVRSQRHLPGPTSSSVASSTSLPSVEVDSSTRKGKDKEGTKAFQIFKPFLDREFPEWSKPGAANLDLGNYHVDDNATILEADDDEDETADLCIAPGLQQFIDYGVQAKQGVTDAKGKRVDHSAATLVSPWAGLPFLPGWKRGR